MTVKEFIEYLKEFEQNKEIVFFEISDLYDMMLVGIDADSKNVYVNVKNMIRGEPKEPLQ